MNKYLLLLTVSVIAAFPGSASALTAADQLKAMKKVFIADFEKMDDNKDGQLSKKEYLSHQFENFRANIISASGFDDEPDDTPTSKNASKDALSSMGDVRNTLQEMADYDVDLDDDFSYDTDYDGNPLPAIDLSVSEDESLKNFIADLNVPAEIKKAEEEAKIAAAKAKAEAEKKAKAEAAKRDEQISMMMQTIKQTLPKKIDDMTTWTDIEYQDQTIAYIYQAEVNTSALSAAEVAALANSVKTEACSKAYVEMCPKLKPLFIDDGIDVKIRYLDKMGTEISICEFNDETCQ